MISLTWILLNSTNPLTKSSMIFNCLRSSSRNENQLHVTLRLPRRLVQAACENVLIDVDSYSYLI